MTKPEITYRRARLTDNAELIKMRLSCGWGEDTISQTLRDAVNGELALYLFESEGECIGMGAIEFKCKGERDLIDPDTNTVMISLLHVYTHYQGKHYGSRVMDIIEDLCEREFGARFITLNTRPRRDDGSINPIKLWYIRRGYVEFKSEEPRYRDGDRMIIACFLRKTLGGGETK